MPLLDGEGRREMKPPIVRWSLSALLLILVWCDVRWALYLTITLLAIGVELLGLNAARRIEREKVNAIFERMLR